MDGGGGFQSTLPLRGATNCIGYGRLIFAHFNPRSPYGERQKWDTMSGSDQLFQSTLPLRGATPEDYFDTIIVDISIHAPLTGSDLFYDTAAYPPLYFNPRSPYGERHFRHALV